MACTPKPIRRQLKSIRKQKCTWTNHVLYLSDRDDYANSYPFVYKHTYLTGCLICDRVEPVRGR